MISPVGDFAELGMFGDLLKFEILLVGSGWTFGWVGNLAALAVWSYLTLCWLENLFGWIEWRFGLAGLGR